MANEGPNEDEATATDDAAEASEPEKNAARADAAGGIKGWHIYVAGVAAVVGGIFAFYYLFPGAALDWGVNYTRGQAKLERKEVEAAGHTIPYLEGGDGPTVLLLHSLGGSKDDFNQFAGHMTSTSRVISMDLPGFGESTRKDVSEYTYEKQAARVHAFVEAIGLEKLHLAGFDMGGAIAAIYAAKHPEKIETVLLIAPMGVETPEMSEYGKALLKNENPMEIKEVSVEETDKFLSYVFTVPPDNIPDIMKRAIAKRALANKEFNTKIAEMLLGNGKTLNTASPFIEKITARSMVMWCDKDRVIHPSGLKVVEEKLQNGKSLMLENCGHVPHTEEHTTASQAYYEFIEQIEGDQS